MYLYVRRLWDDVLTRVYELYWVVYVGLYWWVRPHVFYV